MLPEVGASNVNASIPEVCEADILKVNEIVEGTVKGITAFGAFVEVAPNRIGLVHISEISYDFVKNVSDYLKEGQKVNVKILGIGENKKMELSLKQAGSRPNPKNNVAGGARSDLKYSKSKSSESVDKFEDMMARFKKMSEDKLSDANRYAENRRGKSGH